MFDDVLGNNLVGIKDVSGAKLNQLTNWTWNKITGYVDEKSSSSQNNLEDFKFFLKQDLEENSSNPNHQRLWQNYLKWSIF